MTKRLSPENAYRTATAGIPFDMSPPVNGRVVKSLELPKGVTLFRTGLVLPPDLPEADWKALGSALDDQTETLQWAHGDWWRYGDHAYGKRADAVANGIFRHSFGTLATYGWVCARVPTSIRIEVLSFAHHQVVAPLETAEQRKWLANAARFKWSVKQLRQSIHTAREPWGDRERAFDWAFRVPGLLADASHLADACQIGDAYGQYLPNETIDELTNESEKFAARCNEVAKANRSYQQKRAKGLLKQVMEDKVWEIEKRVMKDGTVKTFMGRRDNESNRDYAKEEEAVNAAD